MNLTTDLTTGEKLQDLRKTQGLTVKQVCDLILQKYGFTLSTGKLNEMENDKEKDFGFKSFVFLAKFYDVTVDWLLGLSDTPSTDHSMQSAVEFTGLSDSALTSLQEYTETERVVLSELLNQPKFQRAIELISAKCTLRKRPKTRDEFNCVFPGHIDIAKEKFYFDKPDLIDSLLQTEFLRATDRVSEIIGGVDNGKHQQKNR